MSESRHVSWVLGEAGIYLGKLCPTGPKYWARVSSRKHIMRTSLSSPTRSERGAGILEQRCKCNIHTKLARHRSLSSSSSSMANTALPPFSSPSS